MIDCCLARQEEIKHKFASCKKKEELYQKIMLWQKELPPFAESWKVEKNLVFGCQSVMYLHTRFENGLLYFAASSDALISSGLAALLITIYDGLPPEVIIKCPPRCIEEIGIIGSLTPSRANGFASIYRRMVQEAIAVLKENVLKLS